jgi:uncharacterized repeat protein (TIGR01451 family)
MFAARSSTYDPSARGPDERVRRPHRMRGLLATLLLGLCAFALPASTAFGEGSVDINTGPGTAVRQALQQVGVNLTVLYVYAQAGETVSLGNSAMGIAGAGNVLVYNPGTELEGKTFPSDPVFGADIFNCDTDAPGTGVIADRDQEVAGPLPNAGGYNPCVFTATTSGIYPVIMAPQNPDPAGNNGGGTVDVPVQGNGYNIAMWDVTVRDAGVAQLGRVFSYLYGLRTSGAGSGGVEVFPYTRTGYEYQVNFTEQGGANWGLYSDDLGLLNAATGESIFASFACQVEVPPQNACNPAFNQVTSAPRDRRYPLFLNRVDPLAISGPGGLADTRGFSATPISPASNPLTNAAFAGSGGQAGATNQGSGGTISFTSPPPMAGLGYSVLIDTNRNGSFGDGPDFVNDTPDLAASGTNAFAWNGRDGAGNVPACGDYQYQVRSTLAELHFTMSDVEFSGGTRLERLSLPNDPALGNRFAASYNDLDPFKDGGNHPVTNAVPITQINGDSSVPGFHAWGAGPGEPNGTGNLDYIDTWAQLPEVQTSGTLRLLCADPQVVKSADPSPAVPGEDVTFRLEVKNNGPDTATNVVATDDLPDTVTFKSASQGCAEAGGVVTCSLASLAAGATHTFEIVAAVPSSVTECLANTATVTNSTPDTNAANNTSTICTPTKGRSGVTLTKAASATTVAPGGQVMYTLVVQNNGPSDDPGVNVTDPLPAGMTLVAADSSQGSCTTANNTVACDLGALKNGGSAQVLVTANAPQTGGCITNTAKAQATNEDPDADDNQASAQVCVEVPPTPPGTFDLAVEKRASVSRPFVGQRVTYTIVVSNNGPDAAPDAKVTDTFNNRATLVSVSTTAGSCTKSIPMTCSLGRIESGASVTITVVIKPRVSGRARNAASATSCCGNDRTPNNNMDTVDITVRKVALKLSKVASRSSVAAGDTLSYRIRVRNPTKGEARNVKVCDRLPSGLRFVSSSPKAKRSGGQRCWTIKRLKAGKSRTYRVTVRTSQGANGRKVNRATLRSPDIKPAIARRPVRVLGQATPVTG